MPCAASVVSTCCCAAEAWVDQERSCASVAYLALASRWATEGVCRTTIERCPFGTAARGSPTSPRQLTVVGAPDPSRPRAETVATSTTMSMATTRSLRALRRGTCIERKVPQVWDGVRVAACGGDHRRVVRAEGKRRQRSVGEGRAQLGIRRHSAHDRDPLCADRADTLHERPDDRPLIGRGEIGASILELPFCQASDAVEE